MNTNIVERNGTGLSWGLIGAVASAVGASVCCLGPLLLLALGIGGAWVGNLTAMEKYRPFWIAATLVFLGLAFFRVYGTRGKDACAPGVACPPDAGRKGKVLLWVVTLMVLVEDVYGRMGLNREEAIRAFWPLVKGTIVNIESKGTIPSLTGPIARGDGGTIRKHMHGFQTRFPELLKIYSEMGLFTVDVAARKGS